MNVVSLVLNVPFGVVAVVVVVVVNDPEVGGKPFSEFVWNSCTALIK